MARPGAVRDLGEVLAVGFAYDRRVWRKVWKKTMANVLAACEQTGARIVFVDNLYQLGPQTKPRTEDMPLSNRGAKPRILSNVSLTVRSMFAGRTAK